HALRIRVGRCWRYVCMLPLSPCLQLRCLTGTTSSEIYSLSLHDALPIFRILRQPQFALSSNVLDQLARHDQPHDFVGAFENLMRSEEHTSELQSRFDLVCRLLLEKKNSNYTSVLRSDW